MKALYPCVLTWSDEDKVYYATFPDVEEAFTDGYDLYEAVEMAEDVLNLILCEYSEDHNGQLPPVPSEIKALKLEDNQTATLIRVDTEAYEALLTRQRWEKKYRNLGREAPQDI